MLFAWWQGFEALPPNFNKLPKHLLCFCFLLPINLCVLRPFQGALCHDRNFPTIPYSFLLPILPVNFSFLEATYSQRMHAINQLTPIPWIASSLALVFWLHHNLGLFIHGVHYELANTNERFTWSCLIATDNGLVGFVWLLDWHKPIWWSSRSN